MPRVVLEKLYGLMMLDVSLPTTGGRELVLARRTEAQAFLATTEWTGTAVPGIVPPCLRWTSKGNHSFMRTTSPCRSASC